jgi:hypothetical protein
MRADADLPWYFGSGASTWAGDAGLRSSLGGQLEAARQFKAPDVTNAPWMAKGSQPHVVDASRAEDDMHQRMGAAWFVRRVRTRLACLTSVQAQALALHYDEKTSLPYSIDASAVLLASARKLIDRPIIRGHYAAARRSLEAIRATRSVVVVHEELGAFLRHRGQARAQRRARGPVDHEVLRRALHDATEAQRKAIESQAAALVQKAKEAYEAVEVEGDDRPVQVRDPRPGRD